MWYSTGDTDVRINETGIWDRIPGMTLKIVLPEPASIRVIYSMSVMPDQSFGCEGETGRENVLLYRYFCYEALKVYFAVFAPEYCKMTLYIALLVFCAYA